MEAVMVLFFAVCNAAVVGVCWYAYGKQDEYRNGMYLGVHVPASQIQNPEVRKLVRRAKLDWNRFHGVNFVIVVPGSFLCYVKVEVFVLLLLVWILVYTGGIYYLTIVPHRRMYQLKKRNGWYDERSKKVSAEGKSTLVQPGKKALKWTWQLVPAAVTVLSAVIVPGLGESMGDCRAGWILYGVEAGVTLTFLLLHIGIYKKEETDPVTVRYWTAGLAGAGWIQAAAWIFLAGTAIYIKWIYETQILIYVLLQMSSAVFLIVCLLCAAKKKKAAGEPEVPALYVDDDEYWKSGWYSNPNDPHLLVPDRFRSSNLTFNWARPAAKWIGGVTGAIVAGVLIWTAGIFLGLMNAEVVVETSGDRVQIEAAGYACEFRVSDTEGVRMLGGLPDEEFVRTNGASTSEYSIGYFRGRKTGQCMMFLYKGQDQVLEIRLKDRTVFVNSKEEGEMEALYQFLAP